VSAVGTAEPRPPEVVRTPTPEQIRRRSFAIVAVALTAIMVIVLWEMSPAIRRQVHLSFTRVPPSYVELYFAAPPSLVRIGATEVVSAPVTLVHHGADRGTYLLRAQVKDPAGPPQTAMFSLAPGMAGSLGLELPVPAGTTAAAVTVRLVGRGESLHYRITAPR
jgi:hypothetical protein